MSVRSRGAILVHLPPSTLSFCLLCVSSTPEQMFLLMVTRWLPTPTSSHATISGTPWKNRRASHSKSHRSAYVTQDVMLWLVSPETQAWPWSPTQTVESGGQKRFPRGRCSLYQTWKNRVLQGQPQPVSTTENRKTTGALSNNFC